MSTTEKKSPSLSDAVLALSASMKGSMSLDKDTGAGTAEKDIYTKNLPSELTQEIVEAVDAHNANFIAAGAHAFGELMVDAMAANKKLETANISIPMSGKNGVDFTGNRTSSFPNPKDPKGDPIVKYATISPTVTYQPGRNIGQLKAARAVICELGLSKLAK